MWPQWILLVLVFVLIGGQATAMQLQGPPPRASDVVVLVLLMLSGVLVVASVAGMF